MKRHIRTIRGPQGLKGDTGLSAYGVWLKAGHTGTTQDFLDALRPKPVIYTAQFGQTVEVGKPVLLECVAEPLAKGRFLLQITGAPEQCVLGLCYEKVPVEGGICNAPLGWGQCLCRWPCQSHPIQLVNYSDHPLCFSQKNMLCMVVFTKID